MSDTQKGPGNEKGLCRKAPGGAELRKMVRSLLDAPDFEESIIGTGISPVKMINPLLCFLYDTRDLIRWRAVRGVGLTVSEIAKKALEPARVIMRRLIWSLNDESGGIGWGAPEAMGEIMAENEDLAREYHRILVSYIDKSGNLLENDALERGAMWGICRLAQKRPELLREWTGPVLAQLKSSDPVKKGLALKTLLFLAESSRGVLGLDRLTPLLEPLLQDQSQIHIFQDGAFAEYKIHNLASELLERLLN